MIMMSFENSDGCMLMGAERRLTNQHDQNQQNEIEDIEIISISLQNLIVKVHQKNCKCNVHKDRNALALYEPIAFIARRIDMCRAADDHKAHDNDRRSCDNQCEIRTSQQTF